MKLRFEPQRIHLILLVFVTIAFYARSIDNYWFKDDLGLGNLTHGHDLAWDRLKLFLWPSHMTSEQFWRPIPMLMGFFDYSFWGANPAGYHIGNTLMHALVGILVYFLVNRLTNFVNPVIGFVAAMATILNPINPESVVWILQRMVLMAAIFSLSAMLCWLNAAQTGKLSWRIAGLFLLACGLLCKEIPVTLPGTFFFIDLFWTPKRSGRGDWKRRLRIAGRRAIPCAAIVVAYLGCRFALWGQFDLMYAGRTPYEYAQDLRVFERMWDSVRHSFVPVNAGVFNDGWRAVLSTGIIVAYGLAVLRGIWLAGRSPVFRRVLVVATAFGVFSFFPTLLAFWVDERLFNGRFFYQPGIATAIVVAAALWLPGRDGEIQRSGRNPLTAAIPYAASTALLLSFAVSLGGGLGAFEEGSEQVRGIQTAAVVYAEQERARGIEPVIVAMYSPSQVKGVPTLETYLTQALKPPFNEDVIECIPLLDVHQNSSEWPETLALHIEENAIDKSRLRYVECTYSPPSIRPVFGVPEPPLGAHPAELRSPIDNEFMTNRSPEPEFRFEPKGKAARFLLRFDTRDREDSIDVVLIEGKNCVRGDGGGLVYKPSMGHAEIPGFPDLWRTVVQQSQPHPIPMTWRIESYDARGRLIGVSANRRIIVFNVY